MPFASNAELPDNVRSVLPRAARSIWRATFNAAFDADPDEEGAIKRAWGAVRNAGWEPGDDGQWIKKLKGGIVEKARTYLRNMVIDEIALVDEGCNPGATILFFKRFGGEGCTPKAGQTRFNKTVDIFKVDEDKRIVYGWATVIEKDGVPVSDWEEDVIEESQMEDAAHLYAKVARGSSEMHERLGIAEMVASVPMTRQVQKALGIDLNMVGWLIGFEVTDDDAWEKVKKHELRMFSIAGRGDRVAVPDTVIVTKRFRRRTNVEDGHDHGLPLPGPPVAAGRFLTTKADGHDHFVVIDRDLEPGDQWGGMTEVGGDSPHQHIVDFMVPDVAQVDQPESQRVTKLVEALIAGTPSRLQVSKAVRLLRRVRNEHGSNYFHKSFPVMKGRVLRAWLRANTGASRADAPAILKRET